MQCKWAILTDIHYDACLHGAFQLYLQYHKSQYGVHASQQYLALWLQLCAKQEGLKFEAQP